MSHADVPAHPQNDDQALALERAIDQRLIKIVLKTGGILFLLFIVAISLL